VTGPNLPSGEVSARVGLTEARDDFSRAGIRPRSPEAASTVVQRCVPKIGVVSGATVRQRQAGRRACVISDTVGGTRYVTWAAGAVRLACVMLSTAQSDGAPPVNVILSTKDRPMLWPHTS